MGRRARAGHGSTARTHGRQRDGRPRSLDPTHLPWVIGVVDVLRHIATLREQSLPNVLPHKPPLRKRAFGKGRAASGRGAQRVAAERPV